MANDELVITESETYDLPHTRNIGIMSKKPVSANA